MVASLIVVLSLALFALPRPAVAAPIIVGAGTPESCTEAALRQALTTAGIQGGGTIKFACGVDPFTITLSDATALVVPNNTTIDGDRVISFALTTYGAPVFVAGGTTVALKDLSISQGSPWKIVNEGNLTLANSTMSGSQGGIDNRGTLKVNTSVFFHLGAAETIPAVHNAGTLTVKDSVFSGNLSGSMAPVWNDGTATIENSSFSNNHTQGVGCIYNTGTLTVKGSAFSGNFGDGGGCILLNAGNLTVKGSVFSGNSMGPGFGGWGGIGNWGMATIENSTFSDNKGVFGGALYNAGTLTISDSAVVGNTAGYYGGGIYNVGTLTIRRSLIVGNTATYMGGGIYTTGGGTLDLKSTFVTGNTPDNIIP
jgi:hypothetical protein